MARRAAALALAALALGPAPAASQCMNNCNRHGTCNLEGTWKCSCYDGWTGGDCSLRTCPKGKAWVGYPHATDAVHDVDVECSNAGSCDQQRGTCSCLPGFTGSACEKMYCPGNPVCGGHGLCMTLRQAGAGYDGVRLVNQPVSYNIWDADRIYGCVCDPGFTGHDCSVPVCVKGDDPLTSGQVAEVQTITCNCGATCSGAFTVTWGGRSKRVLHKAVATKASESGAVGSGSGPGESLESVLEGLRPEGDTFASVVFSAGATTVCSAAGTTSTITFNKAQGNAAQIKVGTGSLKSTSAAAPYVSSATTTDGTTESMACSGRGICSTKDGTCNCMPGFAASDGNGGPGSIPDCGYANSSTTYAACPIAVGSVAESKYGTLSPCNGHGRCSGWPNYTCSCFEGWQGAACTEKACPLGRAWWDEPTDVDTAHALAPCSGRGVCDTSKGVCTCADGFTGAACDRLMCPESTVTTCGGHGRCLSLRELATVGSFGGTPKGQYEVQNVWCNQAAGTFALSYNYATTPSVSVAGTAADLKAALESLPTVGFVDVETIGGATRLCTAGATGSNTRVTFRTDFGDLPAIVPVTSSAGAVVVSEVTKGTRITYGNDPAVLATWDADAIYGCSCDGYPDGNHTDVTRGDTGIWSGPTCQRRECPWGPDPYQDIPAGKVWGFENQTLYCDATSGSFKLSFRGVKSEAIPATATTAQLAAALEGMSTIGRVAVTAKTSSGAATTNICIGTTGATSTIRFLTELGDLPTLTVEEDTATTAGTNVLVSTAQDGTLIPLECSGRGTCDYATGMCKCFKGFASSDGMRNRGGRGDCGAIEPRYKGA